MQMQRLKVFNKSLLAYNFGSETTDLTTVLDDKGALVLSTMISKMPDVAHEAMDQLYTSVRRNRRQYFYLNKARKLIIVDRKILVTKFFHFSISNIQTMSPVC